MEYGNICPQLPHNQTDFIGDEDCLFINVFTPDVAPKTRYPVIVAIHGGYYSLGTGSWLGPDFLLNEDVILVTLNYRLGPLGFLSLGTPEYSGNNGLKDQLLALRWVNRNIAKFGGDVSKITLYGHSAGASSAHLHLLSVESKGLFQRVIMSSGSGLLPWSYNSQGNQLEEVKKFAAAKGVSDESNAALIEFLNKVDVKTLIEGTAENAYVPFTNTKEIHLKWAPVIEGNLSNIKYLYKNNISFLVLFFNSTRR